MARIKTLARFSIRLFLFGIVLGVIGITALWLIIAPSLPSVESLREVRMQVPLRIYSSENLLITEVGEQRRVPVAIEDMPATLIDAVLAAEDDRFFRHPGIDWRGSLRGFLGYARYLGKQRVPGGSTITQQVARRFFLSTEFSVVRKLREMALSIQIERELSKPEILELYMNKEFLGHRAYGVGAAAQIYYGKTVDQLTLAEMAMIAALPQAPSRVNPITNPAAATGRRDWVLDRMLSLDMIDPVQWREARASIDQARLHGSSRELEAPWIGEMARQLAAEVLGANEAYTGGYRVRTTVRGDLQLAADRALRNGLDDYDRRHGWRGPEARLTAEQLADLPSLATSLAAIPTVGDLHPAVVIESSPDLARLRLADGQIVELLPDQVGWAREHLQRDALGRRPEAVDQVLSAGDLVRLRRVEETWRLAQIPEAEAALVALDPETGAILALSGGLDFGRNQFNRVTQSRRQPGSAFKPFIYAPALDHGFTTASLVNDAPVVVEDPSQERAWRPTNFDRAFHGPTRLREAMVHSRNLVSARLLMSIGLEPTREFVANFGFDRAELPPGPSMALGSASITPLSLAAGYAVFANGGYAVEPHAVHAITDLEDHIVWEPDVPVICRDCEPALDEPIGEPLANASAETRDGLAPARLELNPNGTTASTALTRPAGPLEPRQARQVLSPQTTWLVRSMLADVIRQGTGRRAMALGRSDLAGKTGTTNDLRDTWFAGFQDRLVAVVWLGMDDNKTLGRQEQGGRTALPLWVDFMATALDGLPETIRPMPVGLAQARIDPETGLRARPDNPRAITEWFHATNLPALEQPGPAPGEDEEESSDPYEVF